MMKHMKIYKLLIALPLLAGLQACSGWGGLVAKKKTTKTRLKIRPQKQICFKPVMAIVSH